MCQYGNSTYQAGEKFRPDTCTVCHCPRHGGRALCTIQDCLWEPHCLRRHKKSDECCGSCLEQGCLHSDGKVYSLGATVKETKCERCVCPTEGGPTTCTQKVICPEIHCVDPVTDPESCCPSCPNGSFSDVSYYFALSLSLSVCLSLCLSVLSWLLLCFTCLSICSAQKVICPSVFLCITVSVSVYMSKCIVLFYNGLIESVSESAYVSTCVGLCLPAFLPSYPRV